VAGIFIRFAHPNNFFITTHSSMKYKLNYSVKKYQ
jgi:hypothetical protein